MDDSDVLMPLSDALVRSSLSHVQQLSCPPSSPASSVGQSPRSSTKKTAKLSVSVPGASPRTSASAPVTPRTVTKSPALKLRAAPSSSVPSSPHTTKVASKLRSGLSGMPAKLRTSGSSASSTPAKSPRSASSVKSPRPSSVLKSSPASARAGSPLKSPPTSARAASAEKSRAESAEKARSPSRAPSPGKELMRAENERLRSALGEAQAAQDRRATQALHDEAQRTLQKVEELWELTAENERLRAQAAGASEALAHKTAALQAAQTAAAALTAEVAALEASQAEQLAAAADDREEVRRLAATLATLNRHATCHLPRTGSHDLQLGSVHAQRVAHYRRQPSAAYRSGSPRFGKGVELAARGVPAGANAAFAAEHGLRRPCPGSNESTVDYKGRCWGVANGYPPPPYS